MKANLKNLKADETSDLEKAMLKCAIIYDFAVKLKIIKKPLSYALYQTWKYYDEREKERKTEEECQDT